MFLNEEASTFDLTLNQDGATAFAVDYDGFIGGWYLPCKTKGYPIICLNAGEAVPGAEENICLYVDGDYGEVMLSL